MAIIQDPETNVDIDTEKYIGIDMSDTFPDGPFTFGLINAWKIVWTVDYSEIPYIGNSSNDFTYDDKYTTKKAAEEFAQDQRAETATEIDFAAEDEYLDGSIEIHSDFLNQDGSLNKDALANWANEMAEEMITVQEKFYNPYYDDGRYLDWDEAEDKIYEMVVQYDNLHPLDGYWTRSGRTPPNND